MSSIEGLYNQVLRDHQKYPRNKGLVESDEYLKLHAKNPSCGDDSTVQVKVENGVITDVKFDGKGCAICCSSASVMSETLIGKTIEEATEIIHDFYNLIKGEYPENEDRLGDAIVFVNIHNFPPRAKCATLAWRAVDAMLNASEEEDEE